MYISINHAQVSSFFAITQLIKPLADYFSLEQMKRIKNVALAIFSKCYTFFRDAENQSNQLNVKTIAMISCISLIALLVISIFRRRDTRLVPPPTPFELQAAPNRTGWTILRRRTIS